MRKMIAVLAGLALVTIMFAGCFGGGEFSLDIDASEIYRIDGRVISSAIQVVDIAGIEAIVNRLNSYRLTTPRNVNAGGETPEIDLSIFGQQEWQIKIWGGGYIRFTDPSGTSRDMYRIVGGSNAVWEFWEEFGD